MSDTEKKGRTLVHSSEISSYSSKVSSFNRSPATPSTPKLESSTFYVGLAPLAPYSFPRELSLSGKKADKFEEECWI